VNQGHPSILSSIRGCNIGCTDIDYTRKPNCAFNSVSDSAMAESMSRKTLRQCYRPSVGLPVPAKIMFEFSD
jgi:hypothetical protein